MHRQWIAGLLAGAAALSGCASDDSEPLQAFCNGFGNGSTFNWTCNAGCQVLNPALAGDANLDTPASIVPNGGATTETATLLASSVADIPGGTVVGAWVTQPAGLNTSANSFRTLLNGVQQEILNANNGVVISADEGTPAQGFIGIRTTMQFDAVEFTSTNSWNAGQTPVYYVYEICSDGGSS